MKFIVSATNRGSDPVELPHTRQTVDTEDQAKRLVIARNTQERGRVYEWGYYPAEPVSSGPIALFNADGSKQPAESEAGR